MTPHREVLDATLKDRSAEYGRPAENFADVAVLWNTLLRKKLSDKLTAADVCALLIAHKLSRRITSPAKRDNFIDASGYAECGLDCLDAGV